MVVDALVPNWHQAFNNHYDDSTMDIVSNEPHSTQNYHIPVIEQTLERSEAPFLTWFNFDPSMDK